MRELARVETDPQAQTDSSEKRENPANVRMLGVGPQGQAPFPKSDASNKGEFLKARNFCWGCRKRTKCGDQKTLVESDKRLNIAKTDKMELNIAHAYDTHT